MAKQHVFLSYSSKDVAYVDRLEVDLKANDYAVWRDKSALEAGDEWAQEIEEALNDSWAIIVIQTPESEKSRWVRNEVEYAEEHDIPVIPLLVRGDRWFGMYDKQHIDVRGHESQPPPDVLYIALLKYAPPMNLENEYGQELLHGDSARRVNLVLSLENMARNVRSPKARSAQQLLSGLSQDADTYVRNAAQTALKRLKLSTREMLELRPRSRIVPVLIVIGVLFIFGVGAALTIRLIQEASDSTPDPGTRVAQSTIPPTAQIATALAPSPTAPVAGDTSVAPSYSNQPGVLFERRFDDYSTDGIHVISGNWQTIELQNGSVAYCTNHDDWSDFTFGSADWKNYSVEYRVIYFPVEGGGSNLSVVSSLRIQDDSSDYRFEMNPAAGTLMLARWTPTDYHALNYRQTPVTYNTWYSVRGEARDNQLHYSVDGHVMAQASDSTYSQGGAGFEVSPKTHACIDDLIVRRLD